MWRAAFSRIHFNTIKAAGAVAGVGVGTVGVGTLYKGDVAEDGQDGHQRSRSWSPLLQTRVAACDADTGAIVGLGLAAVAVAAGGYYYTQQGGGDGDGGTDSVTNSIRPEDVEPPTEFVEAMKMKASGDMATATAMFSMAAEKGYAMAQMQLAEIHMTAKDVKAAAECYQAAANAGVVNAHVVLGLMYDTGTGVAQDVTKAVEHFQTAANAGDADGAFYLGWTYYLGEGIAKDVDEGMKWMAVSMDQGHPRAGTILAQMAQQQNEQNPSSK